MSYEYWKQKRGDRPMPAESDLDPAEIRKILPHVILLDVRQEPLDFHYRLIGTKMDEHMLGRYTGLWMRSEEHTSELQSLMRNSYAVFCLKKKKKIQQKEHMNNTHRRASTKIE